jgi:uncharacterized linocin/CFP29 family protein
MNELQRELAPISARAWAEIDDEARRRLRHELAARRLVDLDGPHGWDTPCVNLGRVRALSAGPVADVMAAERRVKPLIELRTDFRLARTELDAIDRGADDADLAPLIEAAQRMARAEDSSVFHGFASAGIDGIFEQSSHETMAISSDYSAYPTMIAVAIGRLHDAGVEGPYALAVGPRCWVGLNQAPGHGGYPVFNQVSRMVEGRIVRAPSVDGAILLSMRGGDYQITLGRDLSIGYASHDADGVNLYLVESMTFRVITPEAAVPMAYAS